MSDIPHATPLPAYLRERHEGWLARVYAPDRAWYARLASAGQHPRAMLVSCCDSRVDTVRMFGGEPGDLFVVRNVANLIPPYEPDHHHHGTSAAVEYAVTALGVAHIVVIGHSQCGGVDACRRMCEGEADALNASDSFIGKWLDLLRPGYARAIEKAGAGADGAEVQRRLEEEAVLTSLRNLATFPFVESACREGVLTLHGCWLDIGSGRLEVYDGTEDAFVEV